MSDLFVAEHGRGARPGHVVREYEQVERDRYGAEFLARRVVVDFHDDQSCPVRDCYAASVFADRADAQEAADA